MRKIKKLNLNKQTVRHLTQEALANVAGGVGRTNDCPLSAACPTYSGSPTCGVGCF
jgi:natural product precursor